MKLTGPTQILILVLWLSGTMTLHAEPLNVAVAANFAPTLEKIVKRFTRETGHEVKVSQASTGTLYAQILNGAPYHVFLSADVARPKRLEELGLTRERFTYAIGRLVLWAPGAGSTIDETRLRRFDGTMAIANPSLAPYGNAAARVIERLRIRPGRLVKGSNVAQTFQFVESGNADAGFVALSQLRAHALSVGGHDYWLVPADYYPTIEQQAVVLRRAGSAATRFAAFLRSSPVRGIIEADGYLVANPQGYP